MEKDDNQYQDWQFNSDDKYSNFEDVESIEGYDDNELDREVGMMTLMRQVIWMTYKEERNCHQVWPLVLDS
jgi:hypothetical protein